jgi:two-component system OmpR family response regulator
LKILLIDDNTDISDMLSQYLTIKGNNCTVSNSGRNGLNLIMQEKFDIVILDLAMPEFSGYDVITTLAKNNKIKDVKIIVLTASSINDKDIDEMLSKGVKACIKKPVRLEELIQTIGSFK